MRPLLGGYVRRILHVDLMIDKMALDYVGDWEFGSSTH